MLGAYRRSPAVLRDIRDRLDLPAWLRDISLVRGLLVTNLTPSVIIHHKFTIHPCDQISTQVTVRDLNQEGMDRLHASAWNSKYNER